MASEAMNGHAARQSYRVEVYRVDSPEPVFVRILSDAYEDGILKGLFTHYWQKRSQYCRGADCKISNHATDRTWKGYVAAERLLVVRGKALYVPICLEITEYLELDMRHVIGRGQLWELWKADAGKGKKSPVTGKLHDDEPPRDLRAPFDIMPCLRSVYHQDRIELIHKSPIPARVFETEVAGELPKVLQAPPVESMPDGHSFAEEHRRRAAARHQQTTSPAEKEKAAGTKRLDRDRG